MCYTDLSICRAVIIKVQFFLLIITKVIISLTKNNY